MRHFFSPRIRAVLVISLVLAVLVAMWWKLLQEVV